MLEYRFDLKQDAQLLAKLPNFILGPCSQRVKLFIFNQV
jgi:hypothetical protein